MNPGQLFFTILDGEVKECVVVEVNKQLVGVPLIQDEIIIRTFPIKLAAKTKSELETMIVSKLREVKE